MLEFKEVGVKLLPGAQLPRFAKEGDAGADLAAHNIFYPQLGSSEEIGAQGAIIPRNSKRIFGTGVHLVLPRGFRATLHSRSGLSARDSIEVGAGLIDQGYTGEIRVVLYNHGDQPFRVSRGDRIAQICIEHAIYPVFRLVTNMPTTERGDKGFGHTGVAADA